MVYVLFIIFWGGLILPFLNESITLLDLFLTCVYGGDGWLCSLAAEVVSYFSCFLIKLLDTGIVQLHTPPITSLTEEGYRFLKKDISTISICHF
jgi:hypothetical protein